MGSRYSTLFDQTEARLNDAKWSKKKGCQHVQTWLLSLAPYTKPHEDFVYDLRNIRRVMKYLSSADRGQSLIQDKAMKTTSSIDEGSQNLPSETSSCKQLQCNSTSHTTATQISIGSLEE